MKRRTIIPPLLSSIIMALYTLSPMGVYAEGTGPAPPPLAPLLITEVQPGSTASASEEFVELYNTTGTAIDLSAHTWRLEIAGSTATDWSAPLRTVALSGVVAAGRSYVVASQFSSNGQAVHYLSDHASVWFSAGLSAAAGHIRLTYTTNQTLPDGSCSATQTVVDEVEWSAPKDGGALAPSLDGRSILLTAKSTGVPAGNSLQRLLDPLSRRFIDTNADTTDFQIAPNPTPASSDAPVAAATPTAAAQPAVSLPSDGCSPRPPTGGGVTPDPPGDSPPTTDPGPSGDPSQDGQGGPPDGSPADPPPAIPPADNGLQTPQISELLPNPAAPQTDATDEFVELYNPNDAVFDLSGFTLQAGTTTTHNYTFPEGTILAPRSFTAFFSADTGLSLSNSGGQVALTDPAGAILVRSDVYGEAKDGQAWVFANSVWQWTTSPTPNAVNVVAAPSTTAAAKKVTPTATPKPAAKKTVAAVKAATAKATTAKTAKTKTSGAAASGPTTVAAVSSKLPLHPGILAVIGVIAVLYGAYEYRQDLANYFRRLRDNRAARRKDRQAIARRGGG